jgi:hypothetical protein
VTLLTHAELVGVTSYPHKVEVAPYKEKNPILLTHTCKSIHFIVAKWLPILENTGRDWRNKLGSKRCYLAIQRLTLRYMGLRGKSHGVPSLNSDMEAKSQHLSLKTPLKYG